MIIRSTSHKVIALGLAVAAHAALGYALSAPEEARIEGGLGTQVARLGSSFADMAAGELTPEPTEDQTPPETAEPVTAEQPVETVEAANNADQPARETAQTADTPQPDAAAITPPVEAAPSPNAVVAAPAPATRPETPPVEQALTAAPVQPDTAPSETTPPETAQPAPPEIASAAPAEPTQTIAATQPETAAVTRSKRPVQRSPEFEAQHKPREPEPKPEPKRRVAQKQPQGNANQSARAGETSGAQNGTANRQSADRRASTQAGNAAVSNYPGLVNRRLARIRKPNMRQQGAARVAFTVSQSGGLAALSVARSSGSSRIDSAALDLVRRAAPFPAPPVGAQRRFAVLIEFR